MLSGIRPVKVVKDSKYEDMYRLQWKDKVLSEDMYNLTRANDILRNYAEYRRRMTLAKNSPLLWSKMLTD